MSELKSSLDKTKDTMKFVFIFLFGLSLLFFAYVYINSNENPGVLGEETTRTISNEFILRRYPNGLENKPIVIEDVLRGELTFSEVPTVYSDDNVIMIYLNEGSLTKFWEFYVPTGTYYVKVIGNPTVFTLREENILVTTGSEFIVHDSSNTIEVLSGSLLFPSSERLDALQSARYRVDKFYPSDELLLSNTSVGSRLINMRDMLDI